MNESERGITKMRWLKTLTFLSFMSAVLTTSYAHADLSYGAKFVVTTLSSCAAGGAGAYAYAESTGYDSQPKQVLTFMGATTGCITGALFSYLFYKDDTATLETKISAQQKTIQDLTLQMSDMQGQKQNGSFPGFSSNVAGLPNPFDKLDVKEGKTKSKFDASTLPSGLNLKNCSRLWQYSLIKDGDDLQNGKHLSPQIVAISKNFALVGFTFLYSPNDCFYPSSPDGRYAESYFPGVTDFLKRRVINYNATHE